MNEAWCGVTICGSFRIRRGRVVGRKCGDGFQVLYTPLRIEDPRGSRPRHGIHRTCFPGEARCKLRTLRGSSRGRASPFHRDAGSGGAQGASRSEAKTPARRGARGSAVARRGIVGHARIRRHGECEPGWGSGGRRAGRTMMTCLGAGGPGEGRCSTSGPTETDARTQMRAYTTGSTRSASAVERWPATARERPLRSSTPSMTPTSPATCTSSTSSSASPIRRCSPR